VAHVSIWAVATGPTLRQSERRRLRVVDDDVKRKYAGGLWAGFVV
jgi:hypothetical protein